MKRFLVTAAAAATLLSSTAAFAGPNDRYDRHGDDRRVERSVDRDRGDHRYDSRREVRNERRWNRGERLPSAYYRDHANYVDYRAYHLKKPPRGYQWVRHGRDVYLVRVDTGVIGGLSLNMFF
jgi:Ni/Co efflux regulator RcnB